MTIKEFRKQYTGSHLEDKLKVMGGRIDKHPVVTYKTRGATRHTPPN